MLAALSMSGFALFFLVGDTSQHIAVLVHDVLGLAGIVFVLQHWFFRGGRTHDETR
jgi:hypothetical protein